MSVYDKASLVLIPSGTKTSKVYSQKPVNGDGDFTFSRSTAATRVNADGNIEKETQNLLRYSNVFDNVNWNKIDTTITSGQTGFDGSSNAWLLTKTAANGNIYQSQGYSGVQTLSFYVKANTTDWVRLRSGGGYVYFDVANGNIGIRTNDIDSSITFVANGWYRIEVVWSGSNGISQLFVADGDGVTSGTSGSVYIQYPQLEDGLVARKYLDATTAAVEGGITDNVPRLDYTDSSCPALLLEPQRTNLYTHSEYGGIWNKTLATITDNYAVSPEGLQNAFRANFSSNSGLIYVSGTGATGQDNTLSVWAKSNTGTDQVFRFFANGNTIKSDNFTATNEWQRFTYTHNCTNVTAGITGNSAGGTSDILFYGFQQEAGSYATSYIPTYGTSVTRNVEECSKDNVSDIVGVNDLSLYVEATPLSEGGAGQPPIFYAISENGAQTNICYLQMKPNNEIRFDYYTTGGQQFRITSGVNTIAYGTKFKAAVAIKDNDCVLYVNGTQIGTDTSGSTTNLFNFINCGTYATDDYNGSSIEQMLIFKTRLSNEELAALTTI